MNHRDRALAAMRGQPVDRILRIARYWVDHGGYPLGWGSPADIP